MTYVLIHLVTNLFKEASLLLLAVLVLILHMIIVSSDTVVQIFHNTLIKSLSCSNVMLMALKSSLPCLVLDRVSVLDHTRVLVRQHVAAIMKGLD